MTIAAVLLGALTTHVTTYLMERARNRHQLLTRWDEKKLDAYANYVDKVRLGVFLAVQLYESREGLRASDTPEAEIVPQMADAAHLRGRAFERIMLLAGDGVVEAAHELNALAAEVDWQATGKVMGTLDEWRSRNRAVFRAVNEFHEAARRDLGVQGNVTGEQHPDRGLLLPPARREDNDASRS